MSTLDLAEAAAQPETLDVYTEGDPSPSSYAILDGRVGMIEAYGTDEQRVVRVHGPGRFLGELSVLTGQPELFTAVALQRVASAVGEGAMAVRLVHEHLATEGL